jgi:hypothetical protein
VGAPRLVCLSIDWLDPSHLQRDVLVEHGSSLPPNKYLSLTYTRDRWFDPTRGYAQDTRNFSFRPRLSSGDGARPWAYFFFKLNSWRCRPTRGYGDTCFFFFQWPLRKACGVWGRTGRPSALLVGSTESELGERRVPVSLKYDYLRRVDCSFQVRLWKVEVILRRPVNLHCLSVSIEIWPSTYFFFIDSFYFCEETLKSTLVVK